MLQMNTPYISEIAQIGDNLKNVVNTCYVFMLNIFCCIFSLFINAIYWPHCTGKNMIRKAWNFKFDQRQHISLMWSNISEINKEQAGAKLS